ncbi:hypothetical protein LY625_00170 [Lysobacter sp. GX 14042]|uniref:hypothetical protein n=1 Tax=Lysobacter sp. GX 14042 TaxID=2907155 RepID=UPI001F269FFB|nr:hypothetical protein [Lysobacter sp. GX 14042]MCE7031056.1 hypothetical protein [Lysobacter sp. GX 14042]
MAAGGQQRFIIRFADRDRPAAGSPELRQRLQAIAAQAGFDGLDWQRRLAVGADLVATPAPLDAAGAGRLLQAMNGRPDVDYAETDSLATVASGGPVPPPAE